jgi:uncharacterized protein
MQKAGRNDPCPCGSGKKFKKCCETKTVQRKFQAQVLSSGSTQEPFQQQAQKVSLSLFQKTVKPVVPKEVSVQEENKNPSA